LKALWVLLVALVLAASTPACGIFRSAQSVKIEQTAQVYNELVVALEALDGAMVDYLDSLPMPTENDIARAKDHAKQLKQSRDLLIEAQKAFEQGKFSTAAVKIANALIGLEVVATELEALGVKMPVEVRRALDSAHKTLGV